MEKRTTHRARFGDAVSFEGLLFRGSLNSIGSEPMNRYKPLLAATALVGKGTSEPPWHLRKSKKY